MKGRCRIALTALLSLLVTSGPAVSQTIYQPAEELPESYPDLPGRDLTFSFCAACHGFRIVASQGMSRPQWESSLTWMTQKHNMPTLDPADREVIIGYLSAAFPPKTTSGERAGWTNPFASKP